MDAATTALLLMLRSAPAETMQTTPKHEGPRAPSRIVYDFPVETLAQYMHLRQDQAAKALGIATITLKRICHRRQIRWPYRAYKNHLRRLAKGRKTKASHDSGKEDEERPPKPAPSHAVRPRPVSKDVPELMPRSLRVQYSTQRPKLPSLTETLGAPIESFTKVPFPAKQRPHLAMLVSDQPLMEPAPTLPRLNVSKTMSIFQTPTHALRPPKKDSPLAISPATARSRLLPSVDAGRIVSRTIG